MVLVIDNYDSFTYNLARYIELCGFKTQVVKHDHITLAEVIQLNPSHIVISPGPKDPSHCKVSIEIVRYLYREIPIFGVCLGHQVIAKVFGSQIVRAKLPLHGRPSFISHDQSKLFVGLPNPLKVGRYHSLIVDATHLDRDAIQITALSSEGEVMALMHKEYPLFGVQFHPESVLTMGGLELISNFLRL